MYYKTHMHTCTKRNSKKNKKTKNDGGILVSQFGMHVVILIIMPVIIRFFVDSGQTSGDALYISKQQSSSIIWLPDTDPDVVVTCAYQTCAQLIVTSLTNMADWNRGNVFFWHVFTCKCSAMCRLQQHRADVSAAWWSLWHEHGSARRCASCTALWR